MVFFLSIYLLFFCSSLSFPLHCPTHSGRKCWINEGVGKENKVVIFIWLLFHIQTNSFFRTDNNKAMFDLCWPFFVLRVEFRSIIILSFSTHIFSWGRGNERDLGIWYKNCYANNYFINLTLEKLIKSNNNSRFFFWTMVDYKCKLRPIWCAITLAIAIFFMVWLWNWFTFYFILVFCAILFWFERLLLVEVINKYRMRDLMQCKLDSI